MGGQGALKGDDILLTEGKKRVAHGERIGGSHFCQCGRET